MARIFLKGRLFFRWGIALDGELQHVDGWLEPLGFWDARGAGGNLVEMVRRPLSSLLGCLQRPTTAPAHTARRKASLRAMACRGCPSTPSSLKIVPEGELRMPSKGSSQR